MVDALQHILLTSDIAMFTLIWLVQLVIYPAFHAIERETFVRWHERYTRNISFIVMPLMLAQAAGALLPGAGSEWPARLRLASLISAWTATFALSVPCHKKLHQLGRDETVINRLVQTNWIRTAAWTAAMVFGWLSL